MLLLTSPVIGEIQFNLRMHGYVNFTAYLNLMPCCNVTQLREKHLVYLLTGLDISSTTNMYTCVYLYIQVCVCVV